MRFLIDRCAGRRLAEWLAFQGHDVVESRALGPDPGDLLLLSWAVKERRAVITLDSDFAKLVYVENALHCGLLRLPDVSPIKRIALVREVLERHAPALEEGAIITVRGGKIRIAKPRPKQ